MTPCHHSQSVRVGCPAVAIATNPKTLTRPTFQADLEAKLLFRQELVAVASPHLIKGLKRPVSLNQLRTLPLLHDAHNHWPQFLGVSGKIPGAEFNQTTLALDAALGGQGVALACRAFVAADLAAGRLVQVTHVTKVMKPDYFLVRKRSSAQRKAVEAVWDWCLKRLLHNCPLINATIEARRQAP